MPDSRKPDDRRAAPALGRRAMLGAAGTAGALAAVAAALPGAQPEAPTSAARIAADAADDRGGYQLSEHVRRYYRTARI